MTNQESEYFLDQETGEIVWFNDFAMTSEEREVASNTLDAHGFYWLPTSFDINEYSIMEDFVYSLQESKRDRLARAISGRGAFRRFMQKSLPVPHLHGVSFPCCRRYIPTLPEGCPTVSHNSPPVLFHRHSGLQALCLSHKLACAKVPAGDANSMSTEFQNRSINMRF